MKKILIGTHNRGKFKEISYLISKKYKKISPSDLKIKSPKETEKHFPQILNLKQSFFQILLIIQSYLMILVCVLRLWTTSQEYTLQDWQKKRWFFKRHEVYFKKIRKEKK